MNKEELIGEIANKTGTTKAENKRFLEALLEAFTDNLSKYKTIQLIGFGSFSVIQTSARKGRNPRTGKELNIPAKKRIKFSAGAKLKEKVNKAKSKK